MRLSCHNPVLDYGKTAKSAYLLSPNQSYCTIFQIHSAYCTKIHNFGKKYFMTMLVGKHLVLNSMLYLICSIC